MIGIALGYAAMIAFAALAALGHVLLAAALLASRRGYEGARVGVEP